MLFVVTPITWFCIIIWHLFAIKQYCSCTSSQPWWKQRCQCALAVSSILELKAFLYAHGLSAEPKISWRRQGWGSTGGGGGADWKSYLSPWPHKHPSSFFLLLSSSWENGWLRSTVTRKNDTSVVFHQSHVSNNHNSIMVSLINDWCKQGYFQVLSRESWLPFLIRELVRTCNSVLGPIVVHRSLHFGILTCLGVELKWGGGEEWKSKW